MADVSLPKPIFVVSDGTGDTAEKVVRAALHQFKGYLVHMQVFPNVTERSQLDPRRVFQARFHEIESLQVGIFRTPPQDDQQQAEKR